MAVKKAAKKKPAAKKPALKKATKKIIKKAAPSRPGKTAKKAVKKTVKKTSTPAAASAEPKMPRLSPALLKRNELLKKILLKKRNEVVGSLEQQMGRKLTREAGQKIDSAMDTADQSAQDFDQSIDYSLSEMKYEQYKDIADAFRKLENQSFGLCEECGEEIDIKRLAVNPLARYCISCKTKKEALERIQKEETRFKE